MLISTLDTRPNAACYWIQNPVRTTHIQSGTSLIVSERLARRVASRSSPEETAIKRRPGVAYGRTERDGGVRVSSERSASAVRRAGERQYCFGTRHVHAVYVSWASTPAERTPSTEPWVQQTSILTHAVGSRAFIILNFFFLLLAKGFRDQCLTVPCRTTDMACICPCVCIHTNTVSL